MRWMQKQNLETQQTSIKMSNNYLNNNPIARQFSIETYRLNENQDVDAALKLSVNTLLELFKKIAFDLASDRNRILDSFSKKINSLSDSSSFKNLLAKIKELCEDVEIQDPMFASLKKMYLDSISKVGDSIKRLIELDPSLEGKSIEYFKSAGKKLLSEVQSFTTQEEEKVNESMAIGFPGRSDRLKRTLTNLVLDSKNKDAKSGYGRDWYRLFQSMLQKLSAIDGNKASFTDNDRKNLAELEKKADTLSQEYAQYKVKALELVMSKIMKDDDLASKFGDFSELMTSALDQVTKANTEEGIIEVKIREDLEDRETKMHDKVFPLKQGDKDSDAKLKGSGIIASVQKALIDAFAPIKNLMDPRGGSNGKFESPTAVAIKSIQSSLGNKDVNGKLDKPLLEVILKLDQVSSENKEKIKEALAKLRESYYTVSEGSNAISASEFLRMFESMTYIDPDDIEAKIKVYSEEIQEEDASIADPKTSEAAVAEALAKMLRTKNYNKNAEAEDFLREDGTLKGTYPVEFLDAWQKSISGDKQVAYFFIEDENGMGGLYPTKRLSTNVNKPCNWHKYSEISGHDEEDINNFGKWYTTYWKNFGGVDADMKEGVLKDVIATNCDMARNDKLDDICSVYEEIKDALIPNKDEISAGYLRPSSLKRISQTIKGIGSDDLDSLNPNELRSLYNTLVLICPLVTFDTSSKEWTPALYALSKSIGKDSESLVSEIKKNSSLGKPGKMNLEKIVLIDSRDGSKENEIMKSMVLGSSEDSSKLGLMKSTLDKIGPIIKSLNKHSKRMNIKNSNDLTPDISDSVVVVSFQKKD